MILSLTTCQKNNRLDLRLAGSKQLPTCGRVSISFQWWTPSHRLQGHRALNQQKINKLCFKTAGTLRLFLCWILQLKVYNLNDRVKKGTKPYSIVKWWFKNHRTLCPTFTILSCLFPLTCLSIFLNLFSSHCAVLSLLQCLRTESAKFKILQYE